MQQIMRGVDLDESNPFEAGAGGPGARANEAGIYEPVPMELGSILGRVQKIVTENLGVVAGAVLLPAIPVIAFGFANSAVQMAMEASHDDAVVMALGAAYFAIQVANMLVSVFFLMGQVRIFSRLARGLPAELSMLVGEGRLFLGAIAASILQAIAVLLGLLLLIVPGIIVGLGLQFWAYTMVDRDLGPIEALQESWRITEGHRGTIFLINLVMGLIGLGIACMTCGVGYIVVIPVVALAQAVMYHSLVHLRGGELV